MQNSSILTKESLLFFEKYLNNASPTGFESSGQKIWKEYMEPFCDDFIIDNYGSTVGVINPGTGFNVVIEAHADEISWFVNYISDDGFIYVRRNGGSDHQIAPSKRVNLHTEKGIVRGVFGWPAIHTRKNGSEEAPSLKNIFIDVGATDRKGVEALGIHPGTVVTFDDPFEIINKNYFTARAIDNRAGGFMISQVARLLKKNNIKLPYTLYVVNAVQEEVGLKGATMITETLKPHAAIVTDVCHDTCTPNINKIVEGESSCGKGPVLTYGPAVQYNLLNLILESARTNKIDIQKRAASRATGTDTDAFAYSNGGVPSALISLPLRYMHTTVEMTHRNDVADVVKLIYFSLQKIKKDQDFRYFK